MQSPPGARVGAGGLAGPDAPLAARHFDALVRRGAEASVPGEGRRQKKSVVRPIQYAIWGCIAGFYLHNSNGVHRRRIHEASTPDVLSPDNKASDVLLRLLEVLPCGLRRQYQRVLGVQSSSSMAGRQNTGGGAHCAKTYK